MEFSDPPPQKDTEPKERYFYINTDNSPYNPRLSMHRILQQSFGFPLEIGEAKPNVNGISRPDMVGIYTFSKENRSLLFELNNIIYMNPRYAFLKAMNNRSSFDIEQMAKDETTAQNTLQLPPQETAPQDFIGERPPALQSALDIIKAGLLRALMLDNESIENNDDAVITEIDKQRLAKNTIEIAKIEAEKIDGEPKIRPLTPEAVDGLLYPLIKKTLGKSSLAFTPSPHLKEIKIEQREEDDRPYTG